MSATEVIELIKRLSPEEQEAVREFVAGETRRGESPKPVSPQQAIDVGCAFMDRHPELFRKLAQ